MNIFGGKPLFSTFFRIFVAEMCEISSKRNIETTMATEIRAIPTLYGETARDFDREAMLTEQNPATEDYCHEAQVVADFLKTCAAL